MIRADAAEAEQLGRLTARTGAAMRDANLFSLMVPLADGGLGATRAEFFAAVEEVATADGSAGWCLTACSTATCTVHRALPLEGRSEVFGAGPVAVWSALVPTARSTPAAGGYRVSGAFAWGSGSAVADWVVVGEALPERDGERWFRSYVIAKRDVLIDHDSWRPLGLKATSSIDFRAEDVFVPAHRTFEYPYAQGHGPVSLMFVAMLNQVGLTAFASGVGARALAELAAVAPQIRRAWAASTLADDQLLQHGIGEHQARLAAARSFYLGLVEAQDRHVAEHGIPSAALTLDLMSAALTLARAARGAAVFAFDSVGAGVVRSGEALQRCLVDIFTGLKHATFSPTAFARAGQVRLGADASPPS
jgi:alkylation response protein AidB-like acyl-CoA dehydrogenase